MSKLNKWGYLGALILSSATTIGLQAIPAKPGLHQAKNTDGTSIYIQLNGDESMHYATNSDGHVITQNNKGNYVYLIKDSQGNITESNITAGKSTRIDDITKDYQLVNSSDMARMKNSRISSTYSPMRPYTNREYKRDGKRKGIVILVEFSDVKFTINSPEVEFANMLNIPGYTNSHGQVGSAKDYFNDNSMGKFDPEFFIIGPITLPNTLATYGANYQGNRDKDPARMVFDALNIANLGEINMLELDGDSDGYVDNLFVFYAGYSEAEGASPESIWPHAYNLKDPLSLPDNLLPQKDGVKFNNYACGSELSGTNGTRMSGIGTFCHEFSHILGLPDTYDTDASTNGQAFGLDAWSLMANGPYNGNGNVPPSLNAWERWKSGWLTLTELNEADDYILEPLQESNTAYILNNSANDKEYFILENRQQTMWDRALPGHGMLIYHLDFTSTTPWYNNQVNANSLRQCFELEVADGVQSKSTLSGDPYPGTSNKKEFTDNSMPSSRLWSGQLMGKPITEISENDGIINFKLSGGFILTPPDIITSSYITDNSFELNWDDADRATNYHLDVYTETILDNGVQSNYWDFSNDNIDSELTLSGSFTKNETTFGKSSPSMSSVNLSREITTPDKGYTLESFAFWYNVDDNNNQWSIKLEALSNGMWKLFDTLNKENGGADKVNYQNDNLPENTTKVRVSWSRGSTSNKFSIDDIYISYHDISIDRQYLGQYNNKELGNTNSHKVIGALSSTLYYCLLRSSNSTTTSVSSDPLIVVTSESTNIEENKQSSIMVFKNSNSSITIKNNSNSTLDISIYQTTGVLIKRDFFDGDEKVISIPNSGIYIVNVNGLNYKIAL
ncbi:MAG: M6 family metalloprotease domain-containing protein [Bacteroidales bacterium]